MQLEIINKFFLKKCSFMLFYKNFYIIFYTYKSAMTTIAL